MCGIVGFAGIDADEGLLRRMTGAIVHRGPDQDGHLLEDRIGLGMRRLSIIDVASGRQPIWNEDETVAIVFNGEIYNFRSLRQQLTQRGHRFRTATDTETIVHLYEDHGLDCVHHLRGMFAFALYDRKLRRLFLTRDRLGIKPLYYSERGERLYFASEIKALFEAPEVSREPSLAAIDAYLSLRYVPGPETMFRGVRHLPAGHWLVHQEGRTEIKRYWEPRFHEGPYQSDEYYQERFAELFNETVRLHLESDVPLGAYLSGGVDSTAIVASMSRLTHRPVCTFSVGFDWEGDELPEARETAQRLGCEHHEIICRPADLAKLPKILWHLDEPMGDAIILPTYLLSELARKHVKVVLTGEGGDETLAGYFFHKVMYWAGRYARLTPRFLQRGVIAPAMKLMPTALLNRAFSYPARLGGRGRRKVLDYLDLVAGQQPGKEYRLLTSLFDRRDKVDLYDGPMQSFLEGPGDSWGVEETPSGHSYLHDILKLQYGDWLPSNILLRADKMAMAHGVEGRVPFLDHELVEFLFQVPPHLKLHGLRDKVLLRRYLAGMMPERTAQRKKKPFYIPMDRYITAPAFRDILENCLSEDAVKRRGLFRWDFVRNLRRSIQDNDFLFAKQVFALVMLELWLQMFVDRQPVPVAA